MFCYQCEGAAQGIGCSKVGICGKQPDVSDLQDLLIYALKGMAFWADQARAKGNKDAEIDRFMIKALFTTVTNVDFSDSSVADVIKEAVVLKAKAKALAGDISVPVPAAAQVFELPTDQAALMALLLNLLGFFGGLVMSSIKRDRGVKDWGHMIEGHGGMLDRLDSVCFAAPIFFHLVRYGWT